MRKIQKNDNCCRQKTKKKTAMVCVYLNLMQKIEISFKARKHFFYALFKLLEWFASAFLDSSYHFETRAKEEPLMNIAP